MGVAVKVYVQFQDLVTWKLNLDAKGAIHSEWIAAADSVVYLHGCMWCLSIRFTTGIMQIKKLLNSIYKAQFLSFQAAPLQRTIFIKKMTVKLLGGKIGMNWYSFFTKGSIPIISRFKYPITWF